MAAPVPPLPPHAGAGDRRVSAAGYWVGGAVVVVGLVAATAWFAVALAGLISVPDGYERVPVPSVRQVQLGPGEWDLFHEYRGAADNPFLAAPDVQVTGPGGERVAVARSRGGFSYDWGDHEGVAFARFRAPTAGTYTVSVLGEPSRLAVPQAVAIGREPGWPEARGMVGAMALGSVALLAGLAVVVVTIIRRRAAARRQPGPPPSPPGWGPPAVR